jgi:hypothetical protein
MRAVHLENVLWIPVRGQVQGGKYRNVVAWNIAMEIETVHVNQIH